MPMTIEEARRNPHWLTFGHNDFSFSNILREQLTPYEKNVLYSLKKQYCVRARDMPKLAIIDMEYSSLNFRGIDVGTFAHGLGLSEDNGQIK